MRVDVKEFKGQTKESFTKLETSVGGLSAQLTKLENRVVDTEERITTMEETTAAHGKAIATCYNARRNLWNDVRTFRTGREGKT